MSLPTEDEKRGRRTLPSRHVHRSRCVVTFYRLPFSVDSTPTYILTHLQRRLKRYLNEKTKRFGKKRILRCHSPVTNKQNKINVNITKFKRKFLFRFTVFLWWKHRHNTLPTIGCLLLLLRKFFMSLLSDQVYCF